MVLLYITYLFIQYVVLVKINCCYKLITYPNSPTVHLDETGLGAKRKKRGSISGKSKKISSRALRWKFYKDTLNYDFASVQVPLVGASIALYNFIRRYKIAGNAHTEHVRCSSVLDDMPTAKGGENMDNDLMVWDTDVDMARVYVRIRDHLFHIRNQRLL
ncbi:hypothetical protein CsSME_00010524 [Camellia sinensis var. sinensis]